MIAPEKLLQVKRIASRDNPRLKDWAALSEAKYRDRQGLTLAEGMRLCREGMLAAGGSFRPVAFLVSDAGAGREGAGELFQLAGDLDIERVSLRDDCFQKLSGLKSPDGIALVLAFGKSARNADARRGIDTGGAFGTGDDSADFAAADAAGEAARLLAAPGLRCLVAAGVQDPGNAGALARTALAAGCTAFIMIEGADVRGPKFLRGSMGAAFRFPCLGIESGAFVTAWRGLASRPRLLMASAALPAADYRQVRFASPGALLIGGETGVPEELAALCDERVHIPLAGGVESLNLAVAAGVILFGMHSGGG